jgi:hypothetical protein
MTQTDLNALAVAWSYAKHAEAEAVAQRRQIEDKLTAALGIKETEEGTHNAETLNYTIKVTNRLTRKVDADLIQEIAAEHGLSHLLPIVCRWKPELSMSTWKNLDESVRAKLSQAITTTAGRPSYSISAIPQE